MSESRIQDYDDWSDNNWALDSGRWERNSRAVVKSKRGQRVLAELEDVLLALPVKELERGTFWHELTPLEEHIAEAYGVPVAPQVCVLGAYVRGRGEAYDRYDYLNAEDVSEAADRVSGNTPMVYTLAWNLMFLNDDEFDGMSPASRYRAVLTWVQEKRGNVSERTTT